MNMRKLLPPIVIILGLTFSIAGIKRDRAPLQWQVLESKGDSAFHQYEIENACRYWEESIKENPSNLSAYNKLGISLLILKECDKAINVFQEGLKVDSDSADLHYNLGLACYYSADYAEAQRILEKVLSLNRRYPRANYLKGLCFEKMGRTEEAQKAYIEELNIDPGCREAWRKVKTGL